MRVHAFPTWVLVAAAGALPAVGAAVPGAMVCSSHIDLCPNLWHPCVEGWAGVVRV